MDFHDPQFRADPVQLVVFVTAAIVHEYPAWHTELENCFLEDLLHVSCIILEEEFTMYQKPAGIIDKSKQEIQDEGDHYCL